MDSKILFEKKNPTIQQIVIKMRYSPEPKYRKYVKGYSLLSFTRKFVDKYGKKINEYCNKNRNRCCKTTSKRVVQKTAEATGDFSGNKIADKITSLGKPKSNERNEIS